MKHYTLCLFESDPLVNHKLIEAARNSRALASARDCEKAFVTLGCVNVPLELTYDLVPDKWFDDLCLEMKLRDAILAGATAALPFEFATTDPLESVTTIETDTDRLADLDAQYPVFDLRSPTTFDFTIPGPARGDCDLLENAAGGIYVGTVNSVPFDQTVRCPYVGGLANSIPFEFPTTYPLESVTTIETDTEADDRVEDLLNHLAELDAEMAYRSTRQRERTERYSSAMRKLRAGAGATQAAIDLARLPKCTCNLETWLTVNMWGIAIGSGVTLTPPENGCAIHLNELREYVLQGEA